MKTSKEVKELRKLQKFIIHEYKLGRCTKLEGELVYLDKCLEILRNLRMPETKTNYDHLNDVNTYNVQGYN